VCGSLSRKYHTLKYFSVSNTPAYFANPQFSGQEKVLLREQLSRLQERLRLSENVPATTQRRKTVFCLTHTLKQ
jgi:hypothetical protein